MRSSACAVPLRPLTVWDRLTIVDALDTLWIMDMKDEFYKARDWVDASLHFDVVRNRARALRATVHCFNLHSAVVCVIDRPERLNSSGTGRVVVRDMHQRAWRFAQCVRSVWRPHVPRKERGSGAAPPPRVRF